MHITDALCENNYIVLTRLVVFCYFNHRSIVDLQQTSPGTEMFFLFESIGSSFYKRYIYIELVLANGH